MARSVYLKLEMRIARDERGGIEGRFLYGRELLKKRAGRQRLEKGLIARLVEDAAKNGLVISERELQRRMRFAEVYPTQAHRRQALALMGSWSAIAEANFPEVDIDEPDLEPDDLGDIGESDPLAEPEQLALDIPGFKPILKINGRKVQLAEVTVREAIEYRDMVHEMHENFGRTVAQIDATVETMLDGCDGNLDANAVEAWKKATDPDVEDDDEDPPLSSAGAA